jgi:hypothetical protein
VLAKLAIEKVPCLSSLVMLGIAALCDFVKKTVLRGSAPAVVDAKPRDFAVPSGQNGRARLVLDKCPKTQL